MKNSDSPANAAPENVPEQTGFVLLDETELVLPEAGDVLLVAGPGDVPFWQDGHAPASPGHPAWEDLVSDAGGVAEGIGAVHLPGMAEAGPAGQPPSGHDLMATAEPSLVSIIVDDGSSDPFVA